MTTAAGIQDKEEYIRNLVRQLPDEMRLEFYRRVELQLKDPDTYATLNYLFIAGLHHFYLGKWVRGLTNLLVFCFGLVLVFTAFTMTGVLMIVLISLLELGALFNSQNIVAEYNNKLMEQIYNEVLKGH
jgi:TM2 domain-containing membrane protein YozV